MESIILGKQVGTKISLLSAEKIALRRYFFRKNLDELRLINFILDKLLVLCYTMYTVKRKEVIKMTTDYKSFTNAELSKQIEEIQAELQRMIEDSEKKQRWTEVCNILHNWFQDYGEIIVDTGFIPEITINKEDDYSTIGEIHITYGD